MTPHELVIIGASGFGRETLDVVDAVNDRVEGPVWRLTGVLDDAPSDANLQRLERRSVTYLGTVDEWVVTHSPIHYVVAINNPGVRWRVQTKLNAHYHSAATLVHPSAIRGHGVECGPGVVVCAGVQLSTNVHLGAHAHVNAGAIIGHDTIVGDFVSINPGAVISGSCALARGSLIGAGAVVLQGLSVGVDAVVGAAACVTRDVESRTVVKGVPAR